MFAVDCLFASVVSSKSRGLWVLATKFRRYAQDQSSWFRVIGSSERQLGVTLPEKQKPSEAALSLVSQNYPQII